MASKKKQEDENLRVLREMVTLAHNKHCFDCNQRGPTYVNMTIGSFICTSCSGLLRGLNPPHRVKSISMASFTSEEMEFIKSRGNDFCRKVWLGIHDGRSLADSDLRDENKMRDLMGQKYEKKRWYVHPTDEFYEEARKQNTCSAHKQMTVKPISTLVGHNLPALNVSASQPPKLGAAPTSVATQSIQRPSHGSVYPSAGALQSAVPSAPQSPTAKPNSHPPQKSASLDILADIGGDPFAGTAVADQQSNAGGFADFSAFSSHPAAAQRSPGYLQPHAQSAQPSWPNSTGPGAVPLQPVHPGSVKATVTLAASTPTAAAAAASAAGSDKYSALAELENVFSAMSGPSSVNWDGSSSVGMRSGGGGVFGPAPVQQQGVMSSGYAFSGPPSHSNVPPPSYASLGTTSVANPFGMSGSLSSQTVSSGAVANPFMSSSSGVGGAGYGQPVVSGFGQYHMAPNNIPVSTSSMGAMPGGFTPYNYMAPSAGVQNGGLSGGTVWGVVPPPQRSQVPQQTPGWGQPAQANPFGGIAPPRPSNVTNPFL